MTTQPKPTPSTFFRSTDDRTEEIRKPQEVTIPAAGQSSLGFDALLPPTNGLVYSSALRPWAEVLGEWRARIEREQLADVEIRFYRTATGVAPQGLTMRATDGAIMRKASGAPLALTPRAWQQLLTLLLQEIPGRPTSGFAKCYGFLDPATRTTVFESLKARSRRKEGDNHELLLRTFDSPEHGCRVLRAIVSGRHSGIHFDDLALSHALEPLIPAGAQAWVYRDVDETAGHAIIDTAGEARATIHWSNSETGSRSLSFSGGCFITGIDSVIVGNTEERVEVDLTIAHTRGASRRAHTLPRQNQTEVSRARIARERMTSDIATATDRARHLCAAWRLALNTFSRGYAMTSTVDRAAATELVLDLVEENTKSFAAADREGLTAIFNDDQRLKAIPFASAAYIAGAWAVMASKQTRFEEARRMQAEAARWILEPFGTPVKVPEVAPAA